MEKIALDSLECGGVIIAVTGSLVKHCLERYEMMTLAGTVTLNGVTREDAAVCQEARQVTEIVEVVIDGGDA